MPSAQDVLRRDIDLIGQHCRIVLVGFSVLDDEHRRLKEAHDLKSFTQTALPLLQTFLRDNLGPQWCAPRLNPAAAQVADTLAAPLREARGG